MNRLIHLLSAVFVLCQAALAGRMSYLPDTTDFANPERGWFHQGSLDEGYLRQRRDDDNITVVRRYFRLDSFRTAPIAQQYLDDIGSGLDAARRAGVKVIPLFSYNFGRNDTGASDDAPLARVLEHIGQVAPVLNANHDVILCWDAGFIGAWGEWHSSGNDLDNPDSMRVILFAELDALHPDRMVTVRYHQYKRDIFETDVPLGPADAFNQSRRSRTGHKNDCLGASEYDWGTYAWDGDTEAEKEWLRQENRYLPQQGETCNPSTWSVCDTMLGDLEQMRWDVLNMDYHPDVVQSWRDDGCYGEVCRRLGYRLVLHETLFDDTVGGGQSLTGTLRLSNVGFGKLFNPRGCDLVLRSRSDSSEVRLAVPADPRRWLPDNDTITVDIDIAVPTDIAPGTYDMLWHLPDTATNQQSGQRELADRPEYSIRLASQGVWESGTGYNDLGLGVTVTATSVRPQRHGTARPPEQEPGALYDCRGRRVPQARQAAGVYFRTLGSVRRIEFRRRMASRFLDE